MNKVQYNPTAYVTFTSKEAATVFVNLIIDLLANGELDSNVKQYHRHNHWKFWTMANVDIFGNDPHWSKGIEKDKPAPTIVDGVQFFRDEIPIYHNYDIYSLNKKYKDRIDSCVKLSKSRYFYFSDENSICYYPWMLISESLFNSNKAISNFMFDMFFKRPENAPEERLEHFDITLKNLNNVGIFNADDMRRAHDEIKKIKIEEWEGPCALIEIDQMFSNEWK